jgi:hypothetical protein
MPNRVAGTAAPLVLTDPTSAGPRREVFRISRDEPKNDCGFHQADGRFSDAARTAQQSRRAVRCQRQDAKARSALNAAIRTNATYATIFENLGDVHAKLASQAYDRALELNAGDAATPLKLIPVRSLRVAGGASSTTEAQAPQPSTA